MNPATIESLYVTDTNALYWYLIGDRKLSKDAAAIFEAAERGETQIVVSAIVIAELYYINRKWGVFVNFKTVYNALTDRPEFQFVSLLADDILDFDRDSSVPEMHDRIITGLARRIGAPLITSDPEITASKLVKIAW